MNYFEIPDKHENFEIKGKYSLVRLTLANLVWGFFGNKNHSTCQTITLKIHKHVRRWFLLAIKDSQFKYSRVFILSVYRKLPLYL